MHLSKTLTLTVSVHAVNPRLALWLRHAPIVVRRDAHIAGRKRFGYNDGSRLDLSFRNVDDENVRTAPASNSTERISRGGMKGWWHP
jgi:hypothetical protein